MSSEDSKTPKHAWYQTNEKVVVDILGKNIESDSCAVTSEPGNLTVSFRASERFTLSLDLYSDVDPSKTLFKIRPNKIEVELFKMTGQQWPILERKLQETTAAAAAGASGSSKSSKNWDKLATELDKPDPSEDDVNSLFKKIYSEGTDDVKKAMMKSFYESSGTVLSTNWKDVKEKKVDVKPPEGTEFNVWKN